MLRVIIEREIPDIGAAGEAELEAIASSSNAVLSGMNGEVRWVQSYICAHKTYCVYYVASEAALERYIAASEFPSDVVTRVETVIDPTSTDAA